MRRKNRDALERIEREKVRVAANDVGRMAAHSKFEELVVLRIAASYYPHIHIDPLSLARQGREKDSNIFLIDIPTELFSAQNFIEFGEHCKGKQDFSVSKRQIKSSSWLRFWQEQPADEDVRVEDAPQLCALQKGLQHLRCESPSFRLTSDLIEYLL